MKTLGVGCLIFRYNTENGMCEDFEVLKFKQDVVDTLSAVENISNLEATGIDNEYTGFRSFGSDTEDKVIPIPLFFTLSFDILIPFRIQEEVHEKIDVEKFHVDIEYGYERPVAYFSSETKILDNGSKAVAIVRKFLERKTANKEIVCETIGPSPFHADFSIERSAAESKLHGLVKMNEEKDGYDEFAYYADENATDGEAISQFMFEYNEIFSAFYYLNTMRSKLNRARSEIVRKCTEMLEIPESSGFLKWIRPKIVQSEDIAEIHKNLIKERLLHSETRDFLAEIRRQRPKSENSPIAHHFVEFKDDLSRMKMSDFTGIVALMETRRQTFFSNASVLIAGLFGGIVGAAITALLSLATNDANNQPSALEKPQTDPVLDRQTDPRKLNLPRNVGGNNDKPPTP